MPTLAGNFRDRLKLKKMFSSQADFKNPASAAARERFKKQTQDISTSAYNVNPNRLKPR
jgi:hypothetical protein